jgi:NAD(P)-dependent dehydrogenase (short-subunit alcohol dehydrogenase family)
MSKPTVLVTGASRGIGAAIASLFHDEGWRVASFSRTPIHSPKIELPIVCDITDPAQIRDSVGRVAERFGSLDALINNAGLAGSNPLEPGTSDELWHRIIDVNLHAPYHVTKSCLPLLKDGQGRIIQIASVLALKGVPDQTAYCAAKHGLLGFTRALAQAVAPRGITVNAVCPGWVRTEMAKGRSVELGLTEEALARGVPLGRFLEPEEIARFALFLTRPEAAMITGQALTIDGGVLG